MPITYINRSGNTSVFVWEITEDFDVLYRKAELTPSEEERLRTFRAESRKRQWLCVRACLNKVFQRKVLISYDVEGRPSIDNESEYISISHADDFIAILVGKNRMVGVDIESITRNYKKVVTKFVATGEPEVFVAKNFSERLYLPIIWCAKEAAFKGGFRCEVDFIRDIRILDVTTDDKFSTGDITVTFIPAGKTGVFKYSTLNNHVLVWGEFDDI